MDMYVDVFSHTQHTPFSIIYLVISFNLEYTSSSGHFTRT